MVRAALGSLDPSDRVAIIKRYKNEPLGIFATIWDVFGQEDVFIRWYKNPNTQIPQGCAIKINSKWIIKNPEDQIDIDTDLAKEQPKEQISVKISAVIFTLIQKSPQGIYRIKDSVKIIRDES